MARSSARCAVCARTVRRRAGFPGTAEVGDSRARLRRRAASSGSRATRCASRWLRRFYTEDVPPADGAARHREEPRAGARASVSSPTRFACPFERASGERSNDAAAALLNPGAGWPNKRGRRIGSARSPPVCATSRDLRSRRTWGPGEEPLARAVVDASHGAAELAPATTLADLVTLLAAAALVVSGDTGPIHLAAAAGTPIVGLYGPTDPARNGPWSALGPHGVAVLRMRVPPQAAMPPRDALLDDITVDEVLAAAEARLDRAAGNSA